MEGCPHASESGLGNLDVITVESLTSIKTVVSGSAQQVANSYLNSLQSWRASSAILESKLTLQRDRQRGKT